MAPTSIAGGSPTDVTELTTSRLVYTGTISRHFFIDSSVSMSQSSGAARDIRVAIFKNGVIIPNSEAVLTTTSAVKASTAIHTDVVMNTNDYIELFVKNDGASGNVDVYAAYIRILGLFQS